MLNTVHGIRAEGNASVHVGNITNGKPEQDAINECLANLRKTDPREDKIRIEQAKGGLLVDSYRWVLGAQEFIKWLHDVESRILWVKGDPGKGKTMLLCGIINELKSSTRLEDPKCNRLLSYFFCQETNSGLNNATAVLNGLVYLLAVQQPSLTAHIRDKHHGANKGAGHWNSRVSIEGVLSKILEDPALQDSVLIIDGLDECRIDLDCLLEYIMSKSSNIKWIISSRNQPNIERFLVNNKNQVPLSLEINQKSVSEAISFYIDYKVKELARQNPCSNKTKIMIEKHLQQNANGTFLWVALVCQELKRCQRWELEARVKCFPPGLSALYAQMMSRINEHGPDTATLCMQILSTILTTYRPLKLQELASIEDLPGDGQDILVIIKTCGSFLITQSETIFLVHQSAKDFLLESSQIILFPSGIKWKHYAIFERCLATMNKLKCNIYNLSHPGTHIDKAILSPPRPNLLESVSYSCIYWAHHLYDAAEVFYDSAVIGHPKICSFLTKQSMFWVEALSLLRCLSNGLSALHKLEVVLKQGQNKVGAISNMLDLIHDVRQFIIYFRPAIEEYPLQGYMSGLIFSPKKSQIRNNFETYAPTWITADPRLKNEWEPDLRTLHCGGTIQSIGFSPIGHMLAAVISYYNDERSSNRIKVQFRETQDGALHVMESPGDLDGFASLSPDWRWYAEVLETGLFVWHFNSEDLKIGKLKWHKPRVEMDRRLLSPNMLFSPNGEWLAILYRDKGEVHLWGVESCAVRVCAVDGPLGTVGFHTTAAFSSDAKLVAVARQTDVTVFEVGTIQKKWRFDKKGITIYEMTFIPNTHRLAIRDESSIFIWDLSRQQIDEIAVSWKCEWMVYSPDGTWLATTDGMTVSTLDAITMNQITKYKTYSPSHSTVAISPDGQRLAVADGNGTIWQWDLQRDPTQLPSTTQDIQQPKGKDQSKRKRIQYMYRFYFKSFKSLARSFQLLKEHSEEHLEEHPTEHPEQHPEEHRIISHMAYSDNHKLLALSLEDGTILLRNIQKETDSVLKYDWYAHYDFDAYYRNLNRNPNRNITSFSRDGRFLIAEIRRVSIGVFDLSTNKLLREIHIPWSGVFSVGISHQAHHGEPMVAVAFRTDVCIYGAKAGAFKTKLEPRRDFGMENFDSLTKLAFSPNDDFLILATQVNKELYVWVWDITTGVLEKYLSHQGADHPMYTSLELSHSGRWLLAQFSRHAQLWDVEKARIHAKYTTAIREPRFVEESTMQTEQGMIQLSGTGDVQTKLSTCDETSPYADRAVAFSSAGLDISGSWVTWDGHKVLWLPPSYHLSRHGHGTSVISGNTVLLNCSSGVVLTITLNPRSGDLA